MTDKSLHLETHQEIKKNIAIETYNDHRMAMAFAPLALLVPIKILNAEVVTKSYQKFWEDMQQIGIVIRRTLNINGQTLDNAYFDIVYLPPLSKIDI